MVHCKQNIVSMSGIDECVSVSKTGIDSNVHSFKWITSANIFQLLTQAEIAKAVLDPFGGSRSN